MSDQPSTASQDNGGIYFCYMEPDGVGIDAVYEPFYSYSIENTLEELRPSSPFMAEAAQSAAKCAAYCELYDGCNYFRYDARITLTEHNCRLLSSFSARDEVCCFDNHFADIDKTLPGLTSGRVRQTRSVVDNARVIIDLPGDSLEANESNDFEVSFSVRLGSTPTRGAVWVTPELASRSASEIQLDVTPTQVVLYDNITSVRVQVRIVNPSVLPKDGTVVVVNHINACDGAFTASNDVDGEDFSVIIDVSLPDSDSHLLYFVFAVGFGFLFLVAFAVVFFQWRLQKTDHLWRIKMTELEMITPPVIVGRGTFGLVVLAQYHGTQVAVKKVVPPRYATEPSETAFDSPEPHRSISFEPSSRNPLAVDQLGTSTIQPGILAGPDAQRRKIRKSRETKKAQWSRALRFYNEDISRRELTTGDDETDDVRRLKRRYWERAFQFYAVDTEKLKRDFVSEMRHLARLRHPCVTTCMGMSVALGCFSPLLLYSYLTTLHHLLSGGVVDKGVDPLLVMEYMEFGVSITQLPSQ